MLQITFQITTLGHGLESSGLTTPERALRVTKYIQSLYDTDMPLYAELSGVFTLAGCVSDATPSLSRSGSDVFDPTDFFRPYKAVIDYLLDKYEIRLF